MPGTLFDDPPEPKSGAGSGTPLADRMRPRSLDEVVGQEAIVGAGGGLAGAIAADRVPSLILWGPPGTGKTSIAEVIARETAFRFVPFSAVRSGIREVKEVMADAERWRASQGRRTILFVDEIHRFNRSQQDAFLPFVERGDIVLIGATTENPSFELNAALLSRCQVVVLEPLGLDPLVTIARTALADTERGLGDSGVTVRDEALAGLAQLASGDARRCLNLLEAVVEDARRRDEPEVTAGDVRRIAQRKVLVYDKAGEEHFNLISALHKSLREGDPDAGLYWLARMLGAGEDPLYVARRLVRFASEDVGLADPDALGRSVAAWEAYRRLGSPEGDLALAELVVDLALAPKSNAVYRAWAEARRTVEESPAEPVPASLRNAPTALMKELGYGRGYAYAPDEPEGVAGLECLPPSVAGRVFYVPREAGREAELARRLERWRAARERARRARGE